jgi:hypothetical protein
LGANATLEIDRRRRTCIALLAMMAMLEGSALAGVTLEERKLPMKFSWIACQPNCRGWVNAVGIVTADTPGDFDEFARGRQLGGATIVLDSSGGSVNDSIALGRRWRNLAAVITVGATVRTNNAPGTPASIAPEAYCESMCVFLLLSGKTRYVAETAHVRVHQIWIGGRVDDAKATTYSADDLMIDLLPDLPSFIRRVCSGSGPDWGGSQTRSV